MNTTEFRVEGMTCGGCEKSVTRTIAAIAEVSSVAVDRSRNQAVVTWKEGVAETTQKNASQSICQAVEAAGFDCVIA